MVIIGYSCGIATAGFISELVSEIFSRFGYNQDILAKVMPFSLALTLPAMESN